MKLVIGLLITTVSLVSHAQTQICTVSKIKQEALEFMDKAQDNDVDYIQNCLSMALASNARLYKSESSKPMSLRVQNILAEIKHSEMVAEIKCETTETPGCLGNQEDNSQKIISDEDAALLDQDADLKAKNPIEGKDW